MKNHLLNTSSLFSLKTVTDSKSRYNDRPNAPRSVTLCRQFLNCSAKRSDIGMTGQLVLKWKLIPGYVPEIWRTYRSLCLHINKIESNDRISGTLKWDTRFYALSCHYVRCVDKGRLTPGSDRSLVSQLRGHVRCVGCATLGPAGWLFHG